MKERRKEARTAASCVDLLITFRVRNEPDSSDYLLIVAVREYLGKWERSVEVVGRAVVVWMEARGHGRGLLKNRSDTKDTVPDGDVVEG